MRLYAVVVRRKQGRGVWRFIKDPISGGLSIHDLQREAWITLTVEQRLNPMNEYRVAPIDVPKPAALVAGL